MQQKWGTQKGKNMTIKMKFSRNNTGSITMYDGEEIQHNHEKSFCLISLSEEEPDQIIHTLNKEFPADHVAVFLWPKGNGDFSNPMLKYACNHARFIVVDKKDTPLFLEEEHLIEKKTYVVTEQETWEDIFVRIKKERFPD